MLNFLKTLTPDAIAHLIVIAIIAVLSVVLIVSDYRSRREARRNNIEDQQ
jgi:type II secretory pathway pseudopilin PulG